MLSAAVRHKAPRAALLAQKSAHDAPDGARKISGPEAQRRFDPLVALAAGGEIPLDEPLATAAAQVMGKHWRKIKKGMK